MTSPTAPHGAPLDLPPGVRIGPARAPGADLYVRLVGGQVVRRDDAGSATPYRAGDLIACGRGSTWTLETGPDGARCLVWSNPPGLEPVLATLAAEPRLDRATLVAVATDCGVQLEPEPLPGSGLGSGSGEVGPAG